MAKVLDISTLTTKSLTALYNQLPGVKPVKFWSTRKHALDRVLQGMAANSVMAVQGKAGPVLVAVAAPKAKPAKAARAKAAPATSHAATFADDDTVQSNGARGANPKRAGSGAHARFALYGGGGVTVRQYIEAVEAAGGTSRQARADLAWDSDHGYISLGNVAEGTA